MSALLAGRIAVVTGGGRGLGAVIAACFRAEGAAVVTLDLSDGDEACDVTQEASVAAAFARIAARHGRVDVLVANAGIVRVAAQELGPRGIRVNALGPGPVLTDGLRARITSRMAGGEGPSPNEAFAAHAADTPLGSTATEEEVAKAALFLASDLSSAITGRLLRVDGGLA